MREEGARRLASIDRVLAGQQTAVAAAGELGLSERQMRRLLADFRQRGTAALTHGNTGRTPHHAIRPEQRLAISQLARAKELEGLNYTQIAEQLIGELKIEVSVRTIRRVLAQDGLPKNPGRRRANNPAGDSSMPASGMLLHFQTSVRNWPEFGGARFALLGLLDVRTGEVPAAIFQSAADDAGFFRLLRQLVDSRGLPRLVHAARSIVYLRGAAEPPTLPEQLSGERERTQLGRLLDELGVPITFSCPQRVRSAVEERWGEFERRLIVELCDARASEIEAANCVLDSYIQRSYAEAPASIPDYPSAYGALPFKGSADDLFSFKWELRVAADNTVLFGGIPLKIPPGPDRLCYARCVVTLCQRLDGRISIYHAGRLIADFPSVGIRALRSHLTKRRIAPHVEPARAIMARRAVANGGHTRHRPALDHPWRRALVPNRSKSGSP
jgi:hypothetical protein